MSEIGDVVCYGGSGGADEVKVIIVTELYEHLSLPGVVDIRSWVEGMCGKC